MNKGELIQGRYLLEERLGNGGMGQVWRAVDQRLQRTVAVKLISPQLAEEPEFLVRFLREAQSVARISHPNVVAILDFGEADDKPFLVMEFVPGRPLNDLTGEPMAPEEAVSVIAQAADAAGAAHAEGIVHRDIKPANIVLTDEGRAKLVDFGIASHEDAARITATGTAIGSPHYISPEQASGANATARSDVYALGVVLFELLTGRKPFEGDHVAAVAIAHVETAPPRPSEFVAGLDPHIEQVVLKCLEKDPAERFEDGRALAAALAPGADARTLLVPAAGAAAAMGSTMIMGADDAVPYEEDPFADDEEGSPWKAALIGLVAGLLILGLIVGAYAMLTRDDETAIADDTASEEPSVDRPTTSPSERETTESPTEAPDDAVVPTTAPPPSSAPPPEEPTEEPTEQPTEEPTEEETIETDLEVDPEDEGSNGQGPEGEGPPGQEKEKKTK
ncbi:MAG: protein kinase [Actinomycetota bacterium]|nr:protein kinase [Actinomycetota bacterium]